MNLKSELLSKIPGLLHGFGSRSEPVPLPFAGEWDKRKAQWKQVHQIEVAELLAPGQGCGEVDAQFSSVAKIPVAVMHADCVPILLARRDGRSVAAVHAGWRGTRARILRALWAKLSAKGEHPRDWVGAVGPAIGPCCYEVSSEIAADFFNEFSGLCVPVPRPRMLDLPAINAAELRAIGIGEVELLRACTFCATDVDGDPSSGVLGQPLYHSYRREGGKARQYSVIEILPGQPSGL